MNTELRSLNAKDFAVFAGRDDRLWATLVGTLVDHATYGRGKLTKVESRPNYTPLITIAFQDSEKVWPPKSFESGKTFFLLAHDVAVDVEAFSAAHRANEQAAIEAERQKSEQRKLELQRWASLSPAEKHKERMIALVESHKLRLERIGLPFKGIRQTAASRMHRVTHCYECHVMTHRFLLSSSR